MRVPQPAGSSGSLKWVQRLVNRYPEQLAHAVATGGEPIDLAGVRWVSPREEDGWAEYRDDGFLRVVGQERLIDPLAKFWPKQGPQWDALGLAKDGSVLLVEAKAHVAELASTCAASPNSRTLIDAALGMTATDLDCSVTPAWTDSYYQYANRLAHLRFLQRNGVPAHLLFVYFYGDAMMNGPGSAEEWKQALRTMYEALGIRSAPAGVINAFVDVALLHADA